MTQKELPQMPISSLKPGAKADSVYLLQSVERRTKKNGDPFFMLQLADASGQIGAVIWDNHADLLSGNIARDNFVLVSADCSEYNGTLQMTLKRIARIEDSQVELVNFLPVSPRPLEEMEAELDAWIAQVQNTDCRRLLDRLFGHARFRELYCSAPAAARIHQAYVHGLLEHTLNVVKLADSIASMYQPVNRDVLITGGLLHDVGKIRELDWKRTITYTSEGRMLGHIPMGSMMVESAINELRRQGGFDPDLQMEILHLILSHHGKLEWGSPITPKSREAFVLHYADHAEAYMTVFDNEARQAQSRGDLWTGWNKILDTYIYAGKGAGNSQSDVEGGEPALGDSPRIDGPMDDVAGTS